MKHSNHHHFRGYNDSSGLNSSKATPYFRKNNQHSDQVFSQHVQIQQRSYLQNCAGTTLHQNNDGPNHQQQEHYDETLFRDELIQDDLDEGGQHQQQDLNKIVTSSTALLSSGNTSLPKTEFIRQSQHKSEKAKLHSKSANSMSPNLQQHHNIGGISPNRQLISTTTLAGGTDNGDSEYDLCFVVQEVEFLTFKEGFILHSPYLRDLMESLNAQHHYSSIEGSSSPTPQIRVLLPLWATAKAFRAVLDFVNTPVDQIEELVLTEGEDLSNVQNVLWLADFFQIFLLQRLCIERHLQPRLTYENVLPFIEDAYNKLAQCQEAALVEQQPYLIQTEDMWFSFLNNCLDILARSLPQVLLMKHSPVLNKDLLLSLPSALQTDLMERSAQFLLNQQSSSLLDDKLESVLKYLMKHHKVDTPFDLLDLLKKQAIDQYRKECIEGSEQQQQPKAVLTWKLANLNLQHNFYRESEVFKTGSSQVEESWRLFIAKSNEKECQIGVKCTTNAAPQMMSLLSWVRVCSPNDNAKATTIEKHLELQFSHLHSSTPSQQLLENTGSSSSGCLLRTIPLLLIHQANSLNPSGLPSFQDASVNIEVYFQKNYSCALVMRYIRDRFSELVTSYSYKQLNKSTNGFENHDVENNGWQKLTASEMSLLIKDKALNVKSEDEVIEALILWFKSCLENIEDKVLIESIMKQVYWHYVSFDKLLELYRLFPRLRQNVHSKGIFHHQIMYRATKQQTGHLDQSFDPPQQPRFNYDQVMIEAQFDYHYFLDKISDYLLKTLEPHADKQHASTLALSGFHINATPNASASNSRLQQRAQSPTLNEKVATGPSDNQLSSIKKKKQKKPLLLGTPERYQSMTHFGTFNNAKSQQALPMSTTHSNNYQYPSSRPHSAINKGLLISSTPTSSSAKIVKQQQALITHAKSTIFSPINNNIYKKPKQQQSASGKKKSMKFPPPTSSSSKKQQSEKLQQEQINHFQDNDSSRKYLLQNAQVLCFDELDSKLNSALTVTQNNNNNLVQDHILSCNLDSAGNTANALDDLDNNNNGISQLDKYITVATQEECSERVNAGAAGRPPTQQMRDGMMKFMGELNNSFSQRRR